MDLELYKWAVGILSGIIIAFVIYSLGLMKRKTERNDTKTYKKGDQKDNDPTNNTEEITKHEIPPASASSEASPDDYRSKRRKLI